ncbi:YncE family protein, partial [Streptosporangium sandarakinum]
MKNTLGIGRCPARARRGRRRPWACRALVALLAMTPTAPASADPGGRNLVYVTNYADGTISVIDDAAGRVVRTFRVGGSPGRIAAGPDGRRLYVTDFVAGKLSVIDTVTGAVAATVPVGKAPFGVAVSPDGRRAYVADFGGGGL